MSSQFALDETIMVEWNRQAPKDVRSMQDYETLFDHGLGSSFSKLEAFAKFVRRQTLSKFLARSEIFKLILNVHGSIMDLGVNAGQSLFSWAQLSAIFEPLNYTRMIVGFDSFSGIPTVTPEDRTGPSPSDHLRIGGFAFSQVDQLQDAIRTYDGNRTLGHIPRIELVEGNVIDTLPKYVELNQHLVVGLLHLDLDTYEPTKVALQHVLPLMPKGAVIVFDELNQIPYPGETRAVREVVGLNRLRICRFPWETGISYAVID